MRVQLITRNNQWGLSKDMDVIREVMPQHEYTFTPWDKPGRGRFDVNIHLELIDRRHLKSAPKNVFVPNPEWFMPQWISSLKEFDIVLAKTRDTEAIFQGLHHNVVFSGWTSPDTTERVEYGRAMAFHSGGDSISKGTPQVVDALRRMPEVTAFVSWQRGSLSVSSNVTFSKGRLPDGQYASYRQAPLHICPSTYEGFGHVINEARARGAVVITTGSGPMAEMVTAEYAFMVPHCTERTMKLATERIVCASDLAECIQLAWNTRDQWPTWGARARQAYEKDRAEFITKINSLFP